MFCLKQLTEVTNRNRGINDSFNYSVKNNVSPYTGYIATTGCPVPF